MRRHFLFLLLCVLASAGTHAQITPQTTWRYNANLSLEELYRYERLLYMPKEDWELFRQDERYNDQMVRDIYRANKGRLTGFEDMMAAARGGGSGVSPESCDAWIEPDESYTLTDVTLWPNCGGGGPGVDCWFGPINLPFSFCFFGQNFNQIVLTSKGTIVMGANGYFDWTPSEFPNPVNGADPQYDHICGFWADFDFRQTGEMYYKVTPNAFYLNYVDVGYWSNHTDKKNSFQIIITSGDANLLPNGANVQFTYRDMQFAHGDVGGAGGFNGPTPATVGADRATGNSHVQYGRFNLNSGVYNGPYGQAAAQQDGVNWLDDKILNFNTCLTATNIPPLVTNAPACDTIYLCQGETYELGLQFLSPETNQSVTVTTSIIGSGFTSTQTNGAIASINGTFTANNQNIGSNVVTIIATDNGAPQQSTNLTYVFIVLNEEVPQISIAGVTTICAGGETTLTASDGFDSYLWSTGCPTQSCLIESGGQVFVTGFLGLCSATTSIIVDASNYFIPDLASENEPISICPGEVVDVCLSETDFESFSWSVFPGSEGEFATNAALNQPCVQVSGGGNYVITVEDENGCQGQNIQVVNEIQSFIDPINDNNQGAFCNGLQPIAFTGGFANPQEGFLYVYCISTSAFGWQGSYISVLVEHTDGTSDTFIMTATTAFTINTAPITVGDQITITYVSSGVGDVGNEIRIYNCSLQSQVEIFPVQNPDTPGPEVLTNGVVWTGTSACTAQPLFGQWNVTGPAGWTLTSTTQYNTTFTPAVPGFYTLCFDDPSCANDYCYELEFTSTPSIDLSISQPQLLCDDEVVNTCTNILDLGGTGNITWSGQNVTPDANNCAVAGPYTGYVNTTVSVTITNGCGSDSDSFLVEHQPDAPTPNLNDDFICNDASTVLDPVPNSQDNPNLNYLWTPGNSTGSTLNVTQSGTYTVVVSNDCSTSAPETATIGLVPAANIGNPPPAFIPVCDGEPITLSVNVPAGYSISWSTNATSNSIEVSESGDYCFDVTDNQGCNTSVNGCTEVFFTEAPNAGDDVSEPLILCPGECETLTIGGNAGSSYTWVASCGNINLNAQTGFQWDFCSSAVPATCSNAPFTITGTVTNVCGTDTKVYTVAANQCAILIPNAFSPNGTGKNNSFFIEGLDFYDNVKLFVYDRWGTQVYSNDDYRNNWIPDESLSEGTYFYIVELPVGIQTTYQGTVTIFR